MSQQTLPPFLAGHCEAYRITCGKTLLVVRHGQQVMLFCDPDIFEDWANDANACFEDHHGILEQYNNDEITDDQRDSDLANWSHGVFTTMLGYGGLSMVTLDLRELVNSVQASIGRNVTLFPDPVSPPIGNTEV